MPDIALNGSLRVVLADDHRVVRESLAQALRALGHSVVGEAADGEEAIAKAESTRPDCVVIDVAMPGMDGIAAARRITSMHIPTIALTMQADAETRDRAADAGVVRVLTKDCSVVDVVDAIRAVVAPPPFATARTRRDRGELTSREEEVLRQLAMGLTPREISEQLVISMVTVKNHLAAIYRKLGCRGRTGAVMHAFRSGIVTRELIAAAKPAAGVREFDPIGS